MIRIICGDCGAENNFEQTQFHRKGCSRLKAKTAKRDLILQDEVAHWTETAFNKQTQWHKEINELEIANARMFSDAARLTEERDALRTQLAEAIAALEFYANRKRADPITGAEPGSVARTTLAKLKPEVGE